MSGYKQCLLKKGAARQMAWIPSKFAVEGKYLRLLDDDGWLVYGVGQVELAERPDERVSMPSTVRGRKAWE